MKILLVDHTTEDVTIVTEEIKHLYPSATLHRLKSCDNIDKELFDFSPSHILISDSLPEQYCMKAVLSSLEICKDAFVLIYTQTPDVRRAVEFVRLGAFEYVNIKNKGELESALLRTHQIETKDTPHRRYYTTYSLTEQWFSKFAESAGDIVYRYTFYPSRCFSYVSPSAEHILGYQPQEFYDDPDFAVKIILPEDLEKLNDVVRDANQDRLVITLRWRNKNGQMVWLEHRNILLRDDKGKIHAMEGIALDVTESKTMADNLRKNTYLLDIAGKAGKLGGWSVDLENNIVYWSDVVADIHGMPHGYVPSVEQGISFYAPEYRDRITEVFTRCAKEGVPYDEELQILNSKGERVWVRTIGKAEKDENGVIKVVHGGFQDITEKKNAENQLLLSQQSYAYLFENNPHPMWVYEIETLRFLAVNDTAINKYGYSREEFLRMNLKDIRPASEVERLIDNVQEKKENIQFSGPWKHKLKNGEIIDVEIHSHQLTFMNHAARLVISRDITDKLAVTNELIASNEKFKTLVESSEDGISILDVEGKIVFSNIRLAQILGFENAAELENKALFSFFETEFAHRIGSIHAFLATYDKMEGYEIRLKRADDQFIFAEASFRYIPGTTQYQKLIMCSLRDITLRKNNETRLRLLQRAVEQSSLSIFITDLNGIIEYVNPAFTEITGFTKEEALGKSPSILKSGLQPKEFYTNLWSTILSGSNWEGEYRNKRKDGTIYWQRGSISPIIDSKGVLTHFVAVKENITEKKEKEIELQEKSEEVERHYEEFAALNEELLHTNKKLEKALEKAKESEKLKTSFLNNMSHEIRTPLNGIVGFSELICREELTREEKSDFYSYIQENSADLVNIVGNVVLISQLEAGIVELKEEKTDPIKFVRKCFNEFVQVKHKAGLQFRFNNEIEDQEALMLDQVKIGYIIQQLLDNAFKFTSAGEITLHLKREQHHLCIAVSDTGIGIDPANHNLIFERFIKLEREHGQLYRGNGIGLSIAKAYANIHKGKIEVQSEVGEGSTFTVFIPVVNPDAAAATGVRWEERMKNSIINLLIVEDEKDNSTFLKFIFRDTKTTFYLAENGKEAIELVRQHPEIDLVLMDLKLPIIDGFEATRLIKKMRPELPVIAQSALNYELNIMKAKEAGCDDFISKPLTRLKLEMIFSKLLSNGFNS